ncbi:MAG: CPBP family intramembrane metalloprotease [Chloroflexi bacterium]|nr:CPBP family intramembrane metalloprotease [Chloroflexota bacterium]
MTKRQQAQRPDVQGVLTGTEPSARFWAIVRPLFRGAAAPARMALLTLPALVMLTVLSLTPQERQRRRLEAVGDDTGGQEPPETRSGPRPYLDLVSTRTRLKVAAAVTLLLLAVAELSIVMAGSLGTILYGVLTLGLLIVGGRVASRRMRTLLWTLAVAPTSRLIAFGAPLDEIVPIWRLALVGLLTGIATVIAIRAADFTWADVGIVFRWRQIPFYLLVAGVGVGLGVVERSLVTTLPYPNTLDDKFLPIVTGLGIVDDLLFQGALLEAARRAIGRLAVPFVVLVVGVLHIGYLSPPLGLCAMAIAGVFGLARATSGSLVGVILAHIGLNLGLFVLGPEVGPLFGQLLRDVGVAALFAA